MLFGKFGSRCISAQLWGTLVAVFGCMVAATFWTASLAAAYCGGRRINVLVLSLRWLLEPCNGAFFCSSIRQNVARSDSVGPLACCVWSCGGCATRAAHAISSRGFVGEPGPTCCFRCALPAPVRCVSQEAPAKRRAAHKGHWGQRWRSFRPAFMAYSASLFRPQSDFASFIWR